MPDAAELTRRLGWTARMMLDGPTQRRIPFASPGYLRTLQLKRVRATVSYARCHVPYYREALRRLMLGPEDFRTAHDLARLPLLERSDVQRDPEYFLSDQWPADRCVRLGSGGTTGEPLTVFRDPPSLFAAAAHSERMRSMIMRLTGKRLRYREAQIRLEDSSFASAVNAFTSQTLLPVGARVERRVFSALSPPEQLWQELDRFRPDLIVGYGSHLDELFAVLRRERPRVALPRVLLYGGDTISGEMRDYIQRELGIHVLGTYGSVETPQIGFECDRHRGYHLNTDLCTIRLIDTEGREVTDEQPAEVVVSNLVARATVLLNYRLGDELSWVKGPCPCGRTLPMCSYLGRTKTSWLALGDGDKIHAQELRLVLRGERDVWRYQIVQEAQRRFRVKLVPSPTCDQDGAAARIGQALAERLGARASVEVEFVNALHGSPNQKFQPVISLAQSG